MDDFVEIELPPVDIIESDGLFNVMRAYNSLCTETSLSRLLLYVSQKIGCDRMSVFLKEGEGFYNAAAVGIGEEYVGDSIPEVSVSVAAMKFGAPARLDMSKYSMPRSRYRSDFYYAIPLFSTGSDEPIGVLNVTDIGYGLDEQKIQMLTLASVFASRMVEHNAERTKRADMLLRAVQMRDGYTGAHCDRVDGYSILIARRMGASKPDCFRLGAYAPDHDVGKIGIPDAILNKPGKLTSDERSLVEKHPSFGCQILGDETDDASTILQHHERWDGKGYEFGKSGEEISAAARILACADIFDAMTSDRPYRKGMPVADALREIERASGSQLDPAVADAFLAVSHDEPESINKILSKVI